VIICNVAAALRNHIFQADDETCLMRAERKQWISFFCYQLSSPPGYCYVNDTIFRQKNLVGDPKGQFGIVFISCTFIRVIPSDSIS
jgi:hypothetical protein